VTGGLPVAGSPLGFQSLDESFAENSPAGLGKWHRTADDAARAWLAGHPNAALTSEQEQRALVQFGILGSGNHFVELAVDERRRLGGHALGIAGWWGTSWPSATSGWRRPRSRGWRIPTSRTSSRARRRSTATSGTCCGPRDTPMPLGVRHPSADFRTR